MSIYLSFFQIHNCDLIGMNSLILINSLKDYVTRSHLYFE